MIRYNKFDSSKFCEPKITRAEAPKFKPLLVGLISRLGTQQAAIDAIGITKFHFEFIMGIECRVNINTVPIAVGKKILETYRKYKHLPKKI